MERKKVLLAILLSCIFILATLACSVSNRVTQPTVRVEPSVSQQPLPVYNGLKARIAVAGFEWGVGKGSSKTTIRGASEEPITIEHQAGCRSGLRDALVTALFQTNRYEVLERGEMGAIQEEMSLRSRGYTDQSGIKKGSIIGADLLIKAAITGWDPGSSGAGGKIRAPIPFGVGGVGLSFRKSSLAMEIRIFDTSTSMIVAATRVEGEAKDFGISTGAIAFPLSGSLGMYAKTPMEKAIRACIEEAVRFVAASTPQKYCKY
jgi:curli biogenesis system outer membrane secretion channel CsgG